MTALELELIEDRLDKFATWFAREEVPDYAWRIMAEDFTEMARDVRILIELERARL